MTRELNLAAARDFWFNDHGATAVGSGREFAESLIPQLFDEVARLKGVTRDVTDAEHEAEAQAFIDDMDTLLVATLRERTEDVFAVRGKLCRKFTALIADARWRGQEEERARIRKQLGELLR